LTLNWDTPPFRIAETVKKGKESTAEWIPEIPQNGQYAVYVSYLFPASKPKVPR